MKQSKNNSNDNIVSGRLSAGPKAPKSGVAGGSGSPSYGANRLGIVSNEEPVRPAAEEIVQAPASAPAASPVVPVVPAHLAASAQGQGRLAGLTRQQALPRQASSAVPEAHPGTTGVSPVRVANGQAVHPVRPSPPIFTHKDASFQGLKPMFAPLQQASPAGPTFPPLSRPHGPAAVKRDTLRSGDGAKGTGRSPVDDLWATPEAAGVADDVVPPGAGTRPKVMLIGGGVILLAAIVWACLPSSVKSAYHPRPQAAQASPAEVQPSPQPEPSPRGIDVRTGSPGVPASHQQGEEISGQPGLPAVSPITGESLQNGDTGSPATVKPAPVSPIATDIDATTTKPTQDVATSGPAVVAQPAKTPERQYRPCPPGIRLTGIVQQAGRKVACINGRFRDVGDTIYGAKVVEIKDLSVEMEQDGERFLVGFGSPTDSASDNEAPADEDKSSSQDAPKASKPEPDTQPADTPQPPAKKKHKSKPVDE